jgi:hypothetical protein
MQCGKIAQWGAPWASTRLNDSPIRENNREVDNPILHSSISDSIGATTQILDVRKHVVLNKWVEMITYLQLVPTMPPILA